MQSSAAKETAGYPNDRTRHFFEASMSGDLESVTTLAEHFDDLLRVKDTCGQTALDVAGTAAVAKKLLQLGMRPTIEAIYSAQSRGLEKVAEAIRQVMPGRARG